MRAYPSGASDRQLEGTTKSPTGSLILRHSDATHAKSFCSAASACCCSSLQDKTLATSHTGFAGTIDVQMLYAGRKIQFRRRTQAALNEENPPVASGRTVCTSAQCLVLLISRGLLRWLGRQLAGRSDGRVAKRI